MMEKTRLRDIATITAGPLVVAWFFIFVLDCPDKPREYLLLTAYIILAAVATLGLSWLVHRVVRQRRRGTIISTVLAEVLYFASLTILGHLDGSWFPLLGALIMATFALPMSIGISHGTGRMMNQMEAPTRQVDASSNSRADASA